MTSGLIDPAACRWGQRSTRFLKQVWQAPVVDLDAMAEDPKLAAWAARRLVPKVLLATQGKVLEAVADVEGAWLPSVPVVTVRPHDPDDLWRVLAVLLAPPVCAVAATRYAGSALNPGAIKLSAKQVAGLPTADRRERLGAGGATRCAPPRRRRLPSERREALLRAGRDALRGVRLQRGRYGERGAARRRPPGVVVGPAALTGRTLHEGALMFGSRPPHAGARGSGLPPSTLGVPMNRTASLAVTLAPVAMAASLLVAPAAHADDRTCRGSIGTAQVDDNVIVPRGATCTLNGTRVDGNVEVRSGATLIARGVRVGGNIQAENHERVVVKPRAVDDRTVKSRIGGSIQLVQGGGGRLLRNVVDSDIQLFSNDARFTVRGNVVGGNLQCKSNSPRPVGGDNRVEGNKEDQCQGL